MNDRDHQLLYMRKLMMCPGCCGYLRTSLWNAYGFGLHGQSACGNQMSILYTIYIYPFYLYVAVYFFVNQIKTPKSQLARDIYLTANHTKFQRRNKACGKRRYRLNRLVARLNKNLIYRDMFRLSQGVNDGISNI
jgi:hypothetical protein